MALFLAQSQGLFVGVRKGLVSPLPVDHDAVSGLAEYDRAGEELFEPLPVDRPIEAKRHPVDRHRLQQQLLIECHCHHGVALDQELPALRRSVRRQASGRCGPDGAAARSAKVTRVLLQRATHGVESH